MQPEPLHWEEFAATGAVMWLVARALYVSWHLRQQRAETRERLEALLEAVTDAMGSPDAVLEPNFVEGPLQPKVTPPTEDRLLDLRKALYRQRLKDLLSEVPGAALLPGALHVIVRRSTVLQDTLSIFWQCPVAELLAPNMSVSFEGEVGIDAGGLLRNWFDSVGLALSADASSPLVAEDGGRHPGSTPKFSPRFRSTCGSGGRSREPPDAAELFGSGPLLGHGGVEGQATSSATELRVLQAAVTGALNSGRSLAGGSGLLPLPHPATSAQGWTGAVGESAGGVVAIPLRRCAGPLRTGHGRTSDEGQRWRLLGVSQL
ncbi:Nedd4 [Symbiodinium sp. CCMP2592]|nr:Nedd4 [Symbiodinium sp. CCMP2592]